MKGVSLWHNRHFQFVCMGMNATTAFNIFARAVVREKKIPFEIGAQSTQEKSLTKKQLVELLNTMKDE